MVQLRLLFLAYLAMGQQDHPGDELEPAGNTRTRRRGWNGCSKSKPCGVGQGDCDGDHECQAGTKCGLDNCRDFNARAHPLADCCVGDSKWSYIVDRFTGNYLSAKGSSLETRKSDGSDDQLWAFDSSGMIVNRGSKLVIDGSGSRPVLVPSSPVQSSKQWMMRLDIKSTQEPDANSLVPKLKVNSRNSCLNTANRFLPNGAHIIMYECTGVHPDNAGWNIISAGLPSKICV